MTYYIEENDFLHFYNSKIKIYDCIDEKSPYLVIVHGNNSSRQGYYRFNSKTLYYCVYSTKDLFVNKKLIQTTSKDELKIWMDLNGFKLTGKKIIIGHMYDKLHIYFESFELNKEED